MTGNYLALEGWIGTKIDPHHPDATLTKEDVVQREGQCIDCPMLQHGLPAFVQDDARERFAMVLCNQSERYTTLGMVKGCRKNESNRCRLQGEKAMIKDEALPIRIFDETIVETRYDHQHRTDAAAWTRNGTDVRTLTPEQLRRLAETIATSAATSLLGTLEEIRQIRIALPRKSAEEQRPLLVRLLELNEATGQLHPNAEPR